MYLRALLSCSGRKDEGRFHGSVEKHTKGLDGAERKMYNDPCCHSHDFWTALVTCRVLPRRWRIVRLVMHHECNTIEECNPLLHTCTQKWKTCAPHKEKCYNVAKDILCGRLRKQHACFSSYGFFHVKEVCKLRRELRRRYTYVLFTLKWLF